MKYAHKYQHYAIAENESLIHIKNTINDKESKYYCPYCHQEMIRKCGNVRQWHFAHKIDYENCSYEHYLHTVAEIRIKEWFDKSDKIMLRYHVKQVCKNVDSCEWKVDREGEYQEKEYSNESECYRYAYEETDLKQFFQTCELEKRYENEKGVFVADLFCENYKNAKQSLFIEICVTHECEEEKKNSAIRIIEFRIQSEDDIQKIIDSIYVYENEYTTFYNFRIKEKSCKVLGSVKVQKFILYPSLKAHWERNGLTTCENYVRKRKGIYEISFNGDTTDLLTVEGGAYSVMLAKAMHDGYIRRDCKLCKYHIFNSWTKENICNLHKKYDTKKYCTENNASECKYFRVDEGLYNRLLDAFEEYSQINHVEIWKSLL